MDGWMDEVGRYVQGGLDSRRDGYDFGYVGMMF